jgi:hypothetical protein
MSAINFSIGRSPLRPEQAGAARNYTAPQGKIFVRKARIRAASFTLGTNSYIAFSLGGSGSPENAVPSRE